MCERERVGGCLRGMYVCWCVCCVSFEIALLCVFCVENCIVICVIEFIGEPRTRMWKVPSDFLDFRFSLS